MAKMDTTAGTISTIDPTKLAKRSKDIVGEAAWWCLYGPPGAGKTVTSVTASASCPELPAKQLVTINDVVIWQFDKNGSDSLIGVNVDAPVIDLSGIGTAAELKIGIQAAARYCRDVRPHAVVLDTFTTLNKTLLADLQPKYGDKFGLYQEVLAHHGETMKAVRTLGCNVIFVCHAKVKVSYKEGTEFSDQQKAKEAATETPGGCDIQLDLTGDTLNFLRGQCSHVIPVVASKLGNKDTEYALYPYGYNGLFEWKARYNGFQKKEKPNLYRLMQQVKQQGSNVT